jgi:hypothetical protein
MCVIVAKVTVLTLILGFCLMQTPSILRLVSPGVQERVEYGSMCFDPGTPVLLKRKPTDGHGQFSSPNLPDGWSIHPFTGDIEGIASGGEIGSIHVYATTEAGVVNATVSFEVAPRFTRSLALKAVEQNIVFGVACAVFFYLMGPGTSVSKP